MSLTIDIITSLRVAIASTIGRPLSPSRDRKMANMMENTTIPKTFIPSLVPTDSVRTVLVAF